MNCQRQLLILSLVTRFYKGEEEPEIAGKAANGLGERPDEDNHRIVDE